MTLPFETAIQTLQQRPCAATVAKCCYIFTPDGHLNWHQLNNLVKCEVDAGGAAMRQSINTLNLPSHPQLIIAEAQ